MHTLLSFVSLKKNKTKMMAFPPLALFLPCTVKAGPSLQVCAHLFYFPPEPQSISLCGSIHNLFTKSPVDGQLDCFQVCAVGGTKGAV